MDEVSRMIRKIRLAKKITLQNLSKKTGLSASFLSQVERGESNMTITSLKKIASALGVSIKNLFPDEENTVYARKLEEQQNVDIGGSGTSHKRLSGIFDGRLLEAIVSVYKPGVVNTEAIAHKGEEFVYVLEGEALITVDGQKYIVSKGESIHYPSTLEHCVSSNSDSELKLLYVLTQFLF